jgi:pimeloyl-ACP methyl ester carboxylesterase
LPFLVYALEAYAAYYPEVALERVLAPQAIEHLPNLSQGCIDDALPSGYWVESDPSRQFLSAADLGPVLRAMAENEPGMLRIAAPTLLLQGGGDRTVPPIATDVVDHDLCGRSSPVLYRTYPGVSHDGLLSAAKAEVEAWVDARFSGATATTNCSAPPSAAATR